MILIENKQKKNDRNGIKLKYRKVLIRKINKTI